MKLSQLTEIPQTRDFIEEFGGYNHNNRIAENEFYEMKNMDNIEYPVLAPRKPRGIMQDLSNDVDDEDLAYMLFDQLVKRFNFDYGSHSPEYMEYVKKWVTDYVLQMYITKEPRMDDHDVIRWEDFRITLDVRAKNTWIDEGKKRVYDSTDYQEIKNHIYAVAVSSPHYVNAITNKPMLCYMVNNSLVVNGRASLISIMDEIESLKLQPEFLNYETETINPKWQNYEVRYDKPRQIITMGTQIVVLPDKIVYNLSTNEVEPIEHDFVQDEFNERPRVYDSTEKFLSYAYNIIYYEMCDVEGNSYTVKYKQKNKPKSPTDGDYWIDTSGKNPSLKVYSESTGMWVAVPQTYIKISGYDVGKGLKEGDGVKISGILPNELRYIDNQTIYLYGQANNLWTDEQDPNFPQYNKVTYYPDAEGKIWVYGYPYGEQGISSSGTYLPLNRLPHYDSYVIIQGFLSKPFAQYCLNKAPNNDKGVHFQMHRNMPDMDYVIESNNRLWGCKYDGKLNEIYASKLGDAKNWNTFIGSSTDSYVASIGSAGKFTGAVNYMGYPTFFKESCMHKIYGAFPAQYQIQTTECRGVQEGCHNSLAIVNESLLYKSRTGVMKCDGALPYEISLELGSDTYSNGNAYDDDFGCCAGVYRNKYYISMHSNDDDKWHLFNYDLNYQNWHKEDETRAVCFSQYMDSLLFLDTERRNIYSITPNLDGFTSYEDTVPFSVETGEIGLSNPDHKYITRIDVRLVMQAGSHVRMSIEYDSSGTWNEVFTMTTQKIKSFEMPIRPHRCDHFRLKIEGNGDVKIYSISKTLEQGSDMR